MELGIKNKKALVTGAGRGLGLAISQCLGREGAKVTAVSRSGTDIDKLIDKLGGEENGHHGISMDLMPFGSAEKLLQTCFDQDEDPFDIVVHNVGGTMDVTDPFCSMEQWRSVMRFNFEIAVELNSLIVPKMIDRNWGRVVHVSSISAMENHGPVTYCAAKAALTAYTRSFGGVVAPYGVVVSAVLPGAVFTDGGYWDHTSKHRPEHVEKYLTERQRIGRFGRPEEIGNYVAYLCSELASFNTGSIVPIDGGQGRGYFGQ